MPGHHDIVFKFHDCHKYTSLLPKSPSAPVQPLHLRPPPTPPLATQQPQPSPVRSHCTPQPPPPFGPCDAGTGRLTILPHKNPNIANLLSLLRAIATKHCEHVSDATAYSLVRNNHSMAVDAPGEGHVEVGHVDLIRHRCPFVPLSCESVARDYPAEIKLLNMPEAKDHVQENFTSKWHAISM